MTLNSRQKGARGERELSKELIKLFQAHGVDITARRGQQFCGLEGQDVVSSIEGIHIECKRVEKLNIHLAMAQSEQDAADGCVPVVCHRKNLNPWLVTVSLDNLIKLAQCITRKLK